VKLAGGVKLAGIWNPCGGLIPEGKLNEGGFLSDTFPIGLGLKFLDYFGLRSFDYFGSGDGYLLSKFFEGVNPEGLLG
jgi:hypothetical protein